MLARKLAVPLSPPTSPRMSDAGAKGNEHQWQQTGRSLAVSPAGSTTQRELMNDSQHAIGDPQRPLRSYRSFPYVGGPPTTTSISHEPADSRVPSAPVLQGTKDGLLSHGMQAYETSDSQPRTHGTSAPTSPTGRLTPRSAEVESGEEHGIDDEMDFAIVDGEEEGLERPQMTAAELRAHKRKMKRFRLTHNQTRFLMSEFARQAHPDAAHRERLSREIPGLSPRQVQVWFQNRRAKLKRLNTDDRERMMRSRALPADFDMTQALHAPFGAPLGAPVPPVPAHGSYTQYAEGASVRPLTLDTLRRVPEYDQYASVHHYTTPTGMTPALGAFAFTPPQSATDTISPASAPSSYPSYSYQTQESPRRFHYGGLPLVNPSMYGPTQAQMPRPHLHDRLSRPHTESVGSPLRTSISYSGLGSSNSPQVMPTARASSFSDNSTNDHDRPGPHRTLTGPSGLGFSCEMRIYAPRLRPTDEIATDAAMPTYSPPEQSQQSHPMSQAQHAMEPPQYRRSSSHLAGPPTSTYTTYSPIQYSSPQISQYPSFANQFQPSYQPPFPAMSQLQDSSHRQGQAYAQVPSQPHSFAHLQSTGEPEDDGDNSEGGVALPPTY